MPYFYYSTQTKIAHLIAQNFYNTTFYVYVTEKFDINPPSSNPKKIYETLRDISTGNDEGHDKYINTRKKIRDVAKDKRQKVKLQQISLPISEKQLEE